MADGDYDPRISAAGSGPAVVLVPGMDGTGQLFYRQTPSLAHAFRVATYALRNDTASMDALVADLAHVIDTVAPVERRAIVIGESFGGALALSLALAQPERVDALVILNSFPYFAPQARLIAAIAALSAMPWGAMSLVRRMTAFRMHSPHTHRQELRRFLELTALASREGYINRLRILRQYDVRDRLHDLRVPTLFLASDRDHLVPSVPQALEMAARVPGAVVRVLAGHGHVCLIAPGVDLLNILREWLQGTFSDR
ncbi:MAG: alpha/beta fold hydrolase [Betaproteobacteria bacterium]